MMVRQPMLLVSGVCRCLRLLVTKPRHVSMPPPYTVDTGTSTANATAQPATQRFCAGVHANFFARHEAMQILSTSAAATKPGNTRNRVAQAMRKPEANGLSRFMQQML